MCTLIVHIMRKEYNIRSCANLSPYKPHIVDFALFKIFKYPDPNFVVFQELKGKNRDNI